jgi:phosphoglycolate phosphatase
VRERHYLTYRSSLEAVGGRPLGAGAYWARKRRGAGWPEVLGGSQVAAGLAGPFLERFLAEIEAPWRLRLDRLFPGVRPTLETLRRRGDRLFLVSLRRSSREFLDQVRGLGIAGAFEGVLSGQAHAEGRLAKLHLLRQVELDGPAAVVGDTEADVLAARQLGLAAIAVSSGLRTAAYLKAAGADAVVDGVAQVPTILGSLAPSPSPAATQAASSARPSSSDTSGR